MTGPAKTVAVLGAAGFVGNAVSLTLAAAGHAVLAVPRARIDLSRPSAAGPLADLLRRADACVMAAGGGPGGTGAAGRQGRPEPAGTGLADTDPLAGNLAMARLVASCAPVAPGLHMICLSSDSVFGMGDGRFTEDTAPAPDTAYGAMHWQREALLRQAWPDSTAILRLSQVYGPQDRQNAYGPCRFARQALAGQRIDLFGKGEDRRDHIWIGDVASAVRATIESGTTGLVCVASGQSPTFAAVAALLCDVLPAASIGLVRRRIPVASRYFGIRRLVRLGINPVPVAAGLPMLVSGLARETAAPACAAGEPASRHQA